MSCGCGSSNQSTGGANGASGAGGAGGDGASRGKGSSWFCSTCATFWIVIFFGALILFEISRKKGN